MNETIVKHLNFGEDAKNKVASAKTRGREREVWASFTIGGRYDPGIGVDEPINKNEICEEFFKRSSLKPQK